MTDRHVLNPSRVLRPALALALLLGASACSTLDTRVPEVDVPASFSLSGATAPADRWWTSLGDPQLDRLIEEALAGNFDLQSARDRLAASRALARREGASLLPTVNLDSSGTTTRSEQPDIVADGTSGPGGVSASRSGESYRLGLGASWELDLFGTLRATRDAARADAVAVEADLEAAAVALSAQVAEQWILVCELASQLSLLDAQIATNQEVLELVTMRFRAGQAGAADVLRQRQLVEQRRGERRGVAARSAVARHGLAVLLGRAPREELPVSPAELSLPGPLPATGVPSELLERRPDLRSAWLAVVAADRRWAAATTDRLPRLSLNASAAYGAENLSHLIDNWLATAAVNLTAPITDGGRRRAEQARTDAVADERVHAWGQAMLTALQEVEDALVQESEQRGLVESLEGQHRLATQTLERLRDRYVKGATAYLDVLDALASQQALQRNLVTARRELLGFRIALHRSLAGGFELPDRDANQRVARMREEREF